jgi:hypothetical protein
MATYRIEDSIVKTDNATAKWDEETRWNGNNHVSVVTGSQWNHQTLYKSRRGRYYIECTSQWQGSTPRAEWVSPEEAARWLLVCGYKIPADLQKVAETVEE